jgi:hypothetical protein
LRPIRTIALLSLFLLLAANPVWAHGDDDEVRRRVSCSDDSRVDFRFREHDDELRLRLEVETRNNNSDDDHLWRVKFKFDGSEVFLAFRHTDNDDEFEVEKRFDEDDFEPDVVLAKAHNLTTDELCRVEVTP